MASPKRIYWDACVWIALIQQERIRDKNGNITEDRFAMCREVIRSAAEGHIELATSTLSLAEVFKEAAVRGVGEDKVAAFFEADYLLLVNLDRAVGERARMILLAGYSKMKPADACHLASALLSNAAEMHTFDDKLLALDGKLDKANGTRLKICKPDPGGQPIPLFETIRDAPELPLAAPSGPPTTVAVASVPEPSAPDKPASAKVETQRPAPPQPAMKSADPLMESVLVSKVQESLPQPQVMKVDEKPAPANQPSAAPKPEATQPEQGATGGGEGG